MVRKVGMMGDVLHGEGGMSKSRQIEAGERKK